MITSLKVFGVATAATFGAIVYSECNLFAPKPAYFDAAIKQGVTTQKFDKIFETLCDFSRQLQKGCGEEKGKELVASLLFREDDPLRTWETRYLALTSAVAIHFSFNYALHIEKPLKDKNILIIKQGNTKTKATFDISDSLTKSHNVFLHTFSAKKDKTICQLLEQYHSSTGKPLDAVVIKGHGNKHLINLDDSLILHYRSFDSERALTGCFQKYLKNNAPIIFSSCNTGNRFQANETVPSIAEVAASATGHPVFAPTQVLSDLECRYDISPLPVAEIELRCNKNHIGKNDPPNLQLGLYIKRFDPADLPKT